MQWMLRVSLNKTEDELRKGKRYDTAVAEFLKYPNPLILLGWRVAHPSGFEPETF